MTCFILLIAVVGAYVCGFYIGRRSSLVKNRILFGKDADNFVKQMKEVSRQANERNNCSTN